jgi:hypothetical protein
VARSNRSPACPALLRATPNKDLNLGIVRGV